MIEVVSAAPDRAAIDEAVARGSELLKQGKIDDAQKAFRAALLLDATNPKLLALLGLTHFRAGQFAQARPLYEELVERAPTDASHRLNLGLVYLKVGDADKAITALEASRALDPSQGRAVSYLGLAYARAGRYAEAYRSFLLAGQNDLASEIEINLTTAEREGIHQQLKRSGLEPRTKPPSAPPKSSRTVTGEIARPTPPPPPTPTPAPEPEPDREEPEITVEKPHEPAAPEPMRMTDSLQFVLPTREAIPTPAEGQSVLSRAVEIASPSSAATAAVATGRVAAGSAPPIPLSQLATDELVRPDDGDEPFEVSASGALVIRIKERVVCRLDGVHVTGGELAYEPAQRRSRGHQIEDRFDYGGSQLHVVSGTGYLIAIPGDRTFTAVSLDDDIFYLREDLVFAFESTLRWENGNIPGLRGRLPVVQFRGDGAVALRSAKPLVRVKLPATGVVFVDATRLAGWIGRVIPRAVVPPRGGPMGDMCVECTGEGIVLVDPVGDPGKPAAAKAEPANKPPPTTSPEPNKVDLDLGDDNI